MSNLNLESLGTTKTVTAINLPFAKLRKTKQGTFCCHFSPALFLAPCVWVTKNKRTCLRVFLNVADLFFKIHGSTSVHAGAYKTFCL